MSYLHVPKEVSLATLKAANSSLSAGMYKRVEIPTSSTKPVRDLIEGYDKGSDPGSMYYLRHSTHHFIRTKALQDHSSLIYPKGGAITPISPRVFEDLQLSDGDIIMSKDSNVGECAIVNGSGWKNYMLSGGVVRIRPRIDRYYLFSFLKHTLFREDLTARVPRGATIKHANELWLDCAIPLPAGANSEQVTKYVSALMQSIVEKEIAIRDKNDSINNKIENELLSGQARGAYAFSHPTLAEIRSQKRFDAAIYSESYKRESFLISNYKLGAANYEDMGFDIGRGQNLQITSIGQSIYSDHPRPDFYRLVAPTDISEFRTVEAFRYLGNKRSLDLVKKGDVIFGAEGFGKGRCIILVDEQHRTISNIHGVIFHPRNGSMTKGIFLGCFLGYLRRKGIVDAVGAGGSGGSLAIGYLNKVLIPNFPEEIQEEISKLYHSEKARPAESPTLETLVSWHRKWNQELGIWELDREMKALQRTLHDVQNKIIEGSDVVLPSWTVE